MTINATRDDLLKWMKTQPVNRPAYLENTETCIMAAFASEQYQIENPEAGTWTVYGNNGVWPALEILNFHFSEFQDTRTYGEAVEAMESKYVS